jgi:YbgC/YbaW family acyl-CoA thioester hydrolase
MEQNIVERKIYWGDLDSLGIVFYPRYYEWIDASGHLFFEKIGLNLADLWHARNIAFGLVETSCRYFKPGRYHQTVRIVTTLDTLEQKVIVLKHRIQARVDNELKVEGLEKRICLDVSSPKDFRAINIPSDIAVILNKAL